MGRVKPFSPGSCIRTIHLTRKTKPVLHKVEIKFPSRVHITLIDSNRFAFGKPGAGGMGFAIEMDNRMRISLSDKNRQDSSKNSKPLLAHMTYVMKKILNYEEGVYVHLHTDDFLRPHIGLGYTPTILTACAQGINLLFGSPLSGEEIRMLVAYNYAEEHNGKLIRGHETGVGAHLLLNGGFVIVGGDLKVIYSREFLPSFHVTLIDPGSIQIPHEESEYVPVFKRIQKEDQAFRYHKAYLILMDLIPALYSNNVEAIGDIMWRFQFGGNNLFELEKYPDRGRHILEVMHAVRFGCKQNPIVGLSSVGPIIYAITKDVGAVYNICEPLNVKLFVTKVDNEGVKMLGE